MWPAWIPLVCLGCAAAALFCRSRPNLQFGLLEIFLARDRIAFNTTGRTGKIRIAELEREW